MSDYILDELAKVLLEDLSEGQRFVHLAQSAILRRAKNVTLPKSRGRFVPDDPKDDAIVQTALTAKVAYLVTADAALLEVGKVRGVAIISVRQFAGLLPPR